MIVLGLGSNIGDRLAHLRHALQGIQKIPQLTVCAISPIYLSDALLPEHAPLEWNQPYLNVAMRCETNLDPIALLHQIKKIESLLGRKPEKRHWGPRIIDIDILTWNELAIQSDALTIPHEHIADRPFVLWPLADVAPFWVFPFKGPHQGKTASQVASTLGSRFTSHAAFRTRQIEQRIESPQLVGILNVTPNSFSDGSQFIHPQLAVEHAISLMHAGAEIIDIGAESTAPLAGPVDPELEWARIEPVLIGIKEASASFLLPPKISIDTYHPETAQKALDHGIDWINDVTGLQNPVMCDILAGSTADCVIMHHVSIPASQEHILPPNQPVVTMIAKWAEQRFNELERRGIARERMIFDPGIGFGKVKEHSLALIKQVNVFTSLGTRLLIGHSRKSFFTLFTDRSAAHRDIETVAATLFLAEQPVDYLRVHNVELNARALKVAAALAD